jgi:rod shape-determining protein MreD
MRRAVSWGAVILTALLLQSTVFAQIELFGVKPELTYLITVVLAMIEGPSAGASGGFAAGMAEDFLLNQPKGITALTLTLLGYSVGMIRQYIASPSPALPVLLVTGATAVGQLFHSLVSFLLGELPGGWGYAFRVAVLSAMYNGILTPLAYPIIRRVAEGSRAKRVFRW